MNIWMYWRQGWEKAPYICKKCAYSWSEKNPNHNLFLLDKDNVGDYFNIDKFISDRGSKKIRVQAYTDILRTSLLWKWTKGQCIRLNNWQALHWTQNKSDRDRLLIKVTGIKT